MVREREALHSGMVEEAHKSRHELMGEVRGGKSFNNSDSACLHCDTATY